MSKCRRILILILAAIVIFVFLGIARIHILETKEQPVAFDQENVLADADTETQDNCVLLVKAGGIKTFPFVWSEVLCLYNIETEETYFVDIAKIPYETYRRCFIIGDYVYFEKSVLTEAPDIIRKNLSTGETEEIGISSRNFIVSDSFMLYWERENEKQSMNLHDEGEIKVLIEDGVEDIVSTGNEVYWFSEDAVYEYDLETGTSLPLTFVKTQPEWIYKVGQSEYLFVDEDTLYKGNAETQSQQRLSKEGVVEGYCLYKNNKVYYRSDRTIMALDLEKKESKLALDLNPYMEKDEAQGYVSYVRGIDYCEDYIAVFLEREKENKTGAYMLIFDYQGKLIRSVD